jgi:hypothetical protein
MSITCVIFFIKHYNQLYYIHIHPNNLDFDIWFAFDENGTKIKLKKGDDGGCVIAP